MPYLFVDGGYLREEIREFSEKWCGGADIKFDPNGTIRQNCEKAFYYDCLPVIRPGDTETRDTAQYESMQAEFNRIRACNGWHVYEGALYRRKRNKDKATQKEVDVQIAVDMLTHSHRKNTSKIHFIAGDRDFRPLVEAVVREGIYLMLMHGRTASQDLKDESDEIFALEPHIIHSYLTREFRIAFPFPSVSFDYNPIRQQNSILVGYAEQPDGTVIALIWRSSLEDMYEIQSVKPMVESLYFLRMSFKSDIEKLKFAFEWYCGPLVWKPGAPPSVG